MNMYNKELKVNFTQCCTYIVLFMILMLVNSACEKDKSVGVVFENQSGHDIYYVMAYHPITPNTIMVEELNVKLLHNGEKDSRMVTEEYEKDVFILVFKKDTWENNTLKDLADGMIYDESYSMTYWDWERIGFKLVYKG